MILVSKMSREIILRVVMFGALSLLGYSCAPDPAPEVQRRAGGPVLQNTHPTPQKPIPPTQIFKKCNAAVFRCYAYDGNCYSQGSGFFVRSNGVGVSNYHVFEGYEYYYIELSNGKRYDIEILASNPEKDYVIFKVSQKGKFPYIPISKRKYIVGQKVYALGSPLNTENTFNSGMISQKRNHSGRKLIQVDVPIDHGSSGGVLLNEYGEAIGITSSGIPSLAALNFAIDIHELDADLGQVFKNYKR